AFDRAYGRLVQTTLERLKVAEAKKISPESEEIARLLSTATFDPAAKFEYDAVALTVAAGLETRPYQRGTKEEWETSPLPLPDSLGESRYYKKDVPAHIRLGDPANKHVFILFNASYSTWERGSWINKSIALLRQEFGESHFMVFAGFLTPEFLG